MMATSRPRPEQTRRYQGYPFVDPVVIDVPTLDASTATKWANLPRKPIIPNHNARPPKNAIEAGSSGRTQTETSRVKEQDNKKEDVPVVYIDISDEEDNNKDAISSNQDDRGQENLTFVQDTIFFDPFENRQINLNKPREQGSEKATPGECTPGSSLGVRPSISDIRRPSRPNRLHLNSPNSEEGTSSSVPGFMNKESQVYGQGSPGDGFTLSPLPVTEYPEPPPAYTEVAGGTRPSISLSPPRTVVVGPELSPTIGLPSSNRKLAQCQNCNHMVHTVVVKENGAFTHFVAIITILLCLLPLTVLIYCTDFFKYQVHSCPNCNHRIGYEIPILCKSMVYY